MNPRNAAYPFIFNSIELEIVYKQLRGEGRGGKGRAGMGKGGGRMLMHERER